MFEIKESGPGSIALQGRFDASQVPVAQPVLEQIKSTTYLDFGALDYISSAGLGLLLKTQKRLNHSSQELVLKNMSKHIREIFRYAGFDMIFKIEPAKGSNK